MLFRSDTNSASACIDFCRTRGFNYAGMEYFFQCFCSNHIQSPGARVPDSECTAPCRGNDAEACGGDNRLTIYWNGLPFRYAQPPASLPAGWEYAVGDTPGTDPETLGVRCVSVPALRGVAWPVLQTSANDAGGPDARTLAEVPAEIRRRCEMVVDGGPLPGVASTIVDLRGFEPAGEWEVVRHGGLAETDLRAALEDRAV